MKVDSTDILGGRLQVSPPGLSWSQVFLRAGVVGGCFFLAVVALYMQCPPVRRWADDKYRRRMRRRFGVRDKDRRPFSVAWASQKLDGQASARFTHGDQPHAQPMPPTFPTEDYNLRHRVPQASVNHNVLNGVSPSVHLFSEYQHHISPPGPSAFSQAVPLVVSTHQHSPDTSSSSSTLSQASHAQSAAPVFQRGGKHAREEEADPVFEKKTRLAGDGAQGGQSDGEQQSGDDMEVDEDVEERPKRGAKRSANSEDDENADGARGVGRDKRARKVSLQKAAVQPDVEMVDEEDGSPMTPEFEPSRRGKKRDRTDADSTIDGDDSFVDEADLEERQMSGRRRKRRTISRRSAAVAARGQKRGREVDSADSDEDGDRPKKRDMRKKGSYSGNAAIVAGRIGEEWESNSVRFKVGPNGQRLRQATVRRPRSKFPMPTDSQHPDRGTSIEVYVETWLTEEEYKIAKERRELAWQDTTNEPTTPVDVSTMLIVPLQGFSAATNKGLLWQPRMRQDSLQRGPFRQSVASNLRINPVPYSPASPAPPGPIRRVDSTEGPAALPSTPENAKIRSTRSYSKWEKQDIEAQAMSRIRVKPQFDALPAPEAKKAESAPSFQPIAPAAPAPTFSFAKPAEKDVQPGTAKAVAAPASIVPPASTPSTTGGTSFLGAPKPPTPGTLEAPKTSNSLHFPVIAPAPAAQAKAPAPSTFSFATAPTAATSTGSIQPTTTSVRGAQASQNAGPATGTTPATFSFAKPATTAPSGTSGFNPFGANSQTPSAPAATDSTPKSTFSFGPSSGQKSTEQEKWNQPASSGASGNPLFNRLGSFAPATNNAPATTNAPSGSSNNATFSFAKPDPPANSGTPAAGGLFATPSNAGSTAPASTTGTSTTAPKFNFGFSKPTPSASTDAPAQSGSTTTTTAAPKNTFGFTASPAAAPSGSSSSPSPFGFTPSQPSSSSAFSTNNNATMTAAQPVNPTNTGKSAFGFGPTSSSTTSASNPFAAPAGSSGSGSLFGGAANNAQAKPADSPKPLFSFTPGGTGFSGTPLFGSNQATTSTPAASTSAPSFSFATPASSAPAMPTGSSSAAPSGNTNANQTKPAFSFNFDGAPSSSSSSNPFGTQPATPSGSSNPMSAFAAQPAAPSTSGQAPAFGTQPAASSTFGQQSQLGPGAFGFGNNSGAFSSFNSTTSNQNQKQVILAAAFARDVATLRMQMMSDENSTTPRPRPPAKARRASSLQFPSFPPPPYAPSLDQVVPDVAGAGPSFPDDMPLPLSTHDAEAWVNEKSREELSHLLLKADELIKSRESELSVTSALCKTLFNDNIALKNKHETLLARLPTSPASSVPGTPNVLSPPYDSATLPRSPNYDDAPLPAPRFRHQRRVSVTTSDLTRLADQNAELLDKLERLEAESQEADHAGRRKLRKLEREIQGLREELEQTQEKEAELEEKARTALHASATESQRRREREERVKPFKGRAAHATESDVESEEVRDFAPPSELARPTSLRIPQTTRSPTDTGASDMSLTGNAAISSSDGALSSRVHLSSTIARSQSAAESAIVSQLLAKIHELEQTNAEIKQEQRSTEDRMRSAQWDVESIKRTYDFLNDQTGVALEMVDEDDPEKSPTLGKRIVSGGTIKFSSLQRSIHQDLNGLHADEPDSFAGGISPDMQSTARSVLDQQRHAGSHRPRKSVVGLFEPDTVPGDTSANVSHAPLKWPTARGQAADSESEMGEMTTWSTAATDGMAPPSPFSSMLPTPVEGPGFGRTLGSELGSEFGDDWSANAPNHHLRNTSLYDISGLDLSREASLSPAVSERPLFVFPAPDVTSPGTSPETGRWAADPEAGPSTPPRGLQLTVEPPTPSSADKLEKPGLTRAYRLSQTMRSRTHRWVEGRFSPVSSSDPPRRRVPKPTSVRQRSGMSSAVLTNDPLDLQNDEVSTSPFLHAPAVRDPGADLDGDHLDERSTETERTAVRVLPGEVLGPAGTRRQGLTGLMLEVWLWLQFVLVILVFLWAMAKRGPRSVLDEAERRRHTRGATI
ncbi:hypothetical protein IEO21_00842 [Rhodonia placenta]|uniref:Uncharacterized protein n=1 Tax=Rhodonia placenta TaxID=104341 RepID=A0A8H7PAU6_9APHY|nr:hypothetical protein IEO21_00842 [Postia placenta]